MRLPASSKAYDAEQTLPFPPGGRNTDRMPKATSFVKRRSFSKRYFNTKGAIQKHFALSIAFARSTMDKANNYTRKWKRERAPHKANSIRSSIASNTYTFQRLRQSRAIRHHQRISTRCRGNGTGAASAAETPVVLTETQKIEKILTDRITEQYTMTQIDRITINDDLGTEADGDYIALVYLTWDQKNTGKTSKKMLEMYSSDLAATLGEQNSSVNEIAIFWTVPYLNDTAKCSYQRNGDGFVEMDMAWGKAFQ